MSSLAETRNRLLALREQQRNAARGTGESVVPVARDRQLPLSSTQQRLWFLDQLTPGQAVYNAPIALRLSGPVEADALRRALTALADRHEVLRTRYPLDDGVPYQQIGEPGAEVPLTVIDATTADQGALHALVSAAAHEPFDLAAGPVLRARLFRTAADAHVLLIALHHIAFDGWSAPILIGELFQLYDAACTGTDPQLPELTVQYADYAVWHRGRMTGSVLEEQLGYWRRQLDGLPTLDLPADRSRPALPTLAGATVDLMLPLALRERLNQFARTERVTLLTVALAGFVGLLDRYTGQDDIVLGSIFSGRERPEIEPLIGFFSNTVVLRCSTAGDPTVRELLARTKDTVLGAHFHQDLPFGRLVEEIGTDRDASRNPLFQTSFTLQHAGVESGRLGRLEAEAYPIDLDTARFDLAVQLTELPDGMRLSAEFATDLFDRARIERMLAHYHHVLEAMVADPDRRLSDLPILDAAERQWLGQVSARSAPPVEGCLHEMFEAVVDRMPDAVATSFEGHEQTYRQLDARANRLAWELRDAGVGLETVVGVLLDRGPELPEAFLGILKAGGAYLPLDPDHPPARREGLLASAGCTIVVTTEAYAKTLPEGVRVVATGTGDRGERPRIAVDPANLAYVIFTSGSTGVPKGVQVQHRSIAGFTRASIEMFRLGAGDRVLQFANPAFDVSLFDFFSSLCAGAELVQAPRSTLLDVDRLAALMRERGVTVTDLPPAILGLLDADGFPALRALFVGLEAFPGELVNKWNGPGREFHNGYGPTEATVACIDYLCPDEFHHTMPPIGTPMAGYEAHVLDRYGNPVPAGVPGELYVGGVGVARGYAGQPATTAEKFVPDPFGEAGARLYRTGDLVVRRADGNIFFLGRVDNQIKVRGLRVEPGEIEHVISAHPGVAESVVVLGGRDATSLVAYVTTVDGRELDVDLLRRHLLDRLPAYLVPDSVTVLSELPRAASGKLDRKRLPSPGATTTAHVPVPPSTPTEEAIAGIWRELVDGFTEPDVHTSFFTVGGNSLKVTQLASRIRTTFGVEVELRDLFVHSTVAELAELVEARELDDASDEDLAALLTALEEAE